MEQAPNGDLRTHIESTTTTSFTPVPFSALRIGWSSYYDSPADLHGSEDPEIQKNSEYLRAMWLSRRDAQGFFLAALHADLNEDTPFLVSYAVSKNGRRPFDLTTAIEELGYEPVDNAEDYFV